jgi:hypothetical protein
MLLNSNAPQKFPTRRPFKEITSSQLNSHTQLIRERNLDLSKKTPLGNLRISKINLLRKCDRLKAERDVAKTEISRLENKLRLQNLEDPYSYRAWLSEPVSFASTEHSRHSRVGTPSRHGPVCSQCCETWCRVFHMHASCFDESDCLPLSPSDVTDFHSNVVVDRGMQVRRLLPDVIGSCTRELQINAC